MSNIFHSLNEDIRNFARRPENNKLLTLSYCTPFRGPLFGKYRQEEIATELDERRVDVLMLGSNPNAGDHPSVRQNVRRKYGSLDDQIATGMYSEQYWNPDGTFSQGWSPFIDNARGWKFLLRTIGKVTSLDNVAMANVVPWGSQDIPSLVTAIGEEAMDRVVAFSEDLTTKIISALRPRLVIVPLSLTNLPAMRDTAFARHRHNSVEQTAVEFQSGDRMSTLRYYDGNMTRGGTSLTALHLGHAAYLSKMSDASHERVRPFLQATVAHALAA